MSKIIIPLFIVLISLNSIAQNEVRKNEETGNKITQNNQEIAVYKLFPTENLWIFIKLNTRNGKMWLVQYDIQGNNRFESSLNLLPLITKEKELNGRFTLYKTRNFYTFILLDQIGGNTWQVQWSIEPESRVVLPIE
jgi:hypothetical protein